VLLFEFFPAVVAIVVLVVGIVLFTMNRRARHHPNDETPRTSSRPPVSPDAATGPVNNRRPSMRA
jgi:hypothetical protein